MFDVTDIFLIVSSVILLQLQPGILGLLETKLSPLADL